MQIEHKKLIENGKTVIYLNVYTMDNYEFGKENFHEKNTRKNISEEIKKYIKKNVEYIQGAVIVLAINGILIGALTMGQDEKLNEVGNNIYNEIYVEQALDEENETSTEKETEEKEAIKPNEVIATVEVKKEEEKKEVVVSKSQTTTTNTSTSTNKSNTSAKPSTTNSTTTNTTKPSVNNSTSTTTTKPNTNSNTTTSTNTTSKEEQKQEEVTNQGIYVTLNTNGTVQKIELETYIIGVVAAEMPASFNSEALKAQAVAARTYAMKRVSQGITLKNSTADQVYKTTDQMKATWGSSYNTYYNKIKNAVNATKGLVLKYNGEYIDAQYCSMTNGKTEQPEYVWSYSRPYLQCVSSTWDTKVNGFEVTKEFTYAKVSSALGQEITKDTVITVLSRTVSDRVEKIQIGDIVYTGTQIRSKLGLRSTDFTIVLGDSNIQITTKGYGHGVGMSQYGAHMAANEGYTYRQILNHYYVGAQIVQI